MVDSFYKRVNQDPLLSPVFNDFAAVDWEKHLPRMYSFWNTLILGAQSYKGSPFDVHIPLPVNQSHFDRWVALFEQNVDQGFKGSKAEEAKLRARSIAHIFRTKLDMINKLKQEEN